MSLKERSVEFGLISNFRSLSGFKGWRNKAIPPGKIYRSARPDAASEQDVNKMIKDLNIRTVLDLRSKREIMATEPKKKQPLKEEKQEEVDEKKESVLQKSPSNEKVEIKSSISNESLRKFFNFQEIKISATGSVKKQNEISIELQDNPENENEHENENQNEEDEEDENEKKNEKVNLNEKKRKMKENQPRVQRKIVRLDLSGLFLFYMSNIFVKIVGGLLYIFGFHELAGKIFIQQTLNKKGLTGMYIGFAEFSKKQILEALNVIADKENLPIVIHCTQGKDRTGILSALVLHILGVSEEEIIEDYSYSKEQLHKEMNMLLEHAKVYGLDPVFMDSPASSLKEFFIYLKSKYGSIDRYLDHIGFDENRRDQMRRTVFDHID